MTNEIVGKFQEFIKNSLLIDQSILIDSLLDGYSEELDIHNAEEFTIKFSSGRKQVVTLSLLNYSIEDYENILSRKKIKEDGADNKAHEQLQQEIDDMEFDINAMKTAVADKRFVFYWLLIPYWLSKELINHDQVVLNYMGNHYWGVTNIAGDDSPNEILNMLFEELI